MTDDPNAPGEDPTGAEVDPTGGLASLFGGGDMSGLLEQAQGLVAAQQEVAEAVVTGSSGGGLVQIDVTGGGGFIDVRIDPEAVDADDVPVLEDLVLAALRDCNEKIAELQSRAMGGLGGLLGGTGDPLAPLLDGSVDEDEEQ